MLNILRIACLWSVVRRLQTFLPRIVSPLRGLMVLTITFDRKLRTLAYGYLRVLPLRGLKRLQTTDHRLQTFNSLNTKQLAKLLSLSS